MDPVTATDTSATNSTAVRTVDARGQSCPGPLMTLARDLKEVRPGSIVQLLATDPGSLTDVPAWCKLTGNELVDRGEDGGEFRYLIRIT